MSKLHQNVRCMGSLWLWFSPTLALWYYDMLCTSGFVDSVMLAHIGQAYICRSEKVCMLKVTN